MKESTQSPTFCISLSKYYSFPALDQVYSGLFAVYKHGAYRHVLKMDVHLPLATTKVDLPITRSNSTGLELQLSIC